MRATVFIGLTLLTLVSATHAGAQSPQMVHAQLVADVAEVQPGKPFWVGVFFQVEPGWHIYWKNPGDSGLATTVEFTLPEGFELDELKYPMPKRFDQPGGIVGYGYEDSLMLLAAITPPEDLPQKPVKLSATASWLSCAEVCIPGQALLSLDLPVGEWKPANKELFEEWSGRLPSVVEPAGVDVAVRPTQLVNRASGWFELLVRSSDPLKDVEFFPGAVEGLMLTDLKVTPTDRGAQITFTAELLKGYKLDAEFLPALVTYTDAGGRRRGFDVMIPVQ